MTRFIVFILLGPPVGAAWLTLFTLPHETTHVGAPGALNGVIVSAYVFGAGPATVTGVIAALCARAARFVDRAALPLLVGTILSAPLGGLEGEKSALDLLLMGSVGGLSTALCIVCVECVRFMPDAVTDRP